MSMVPPPLPPQPQPTATAGSTFRLVIANGNGIPWLATKVGRALAGNGMPAARLVNLKPYREPRTTITYRDGYRDQALQLGRALDREPRLARETGLHSGADVQLTLGKDATSPMSLFGPGSARPRLAKKDMPLADPRS